MPKPKKIAISKLDRLWSELVKLRARGRCEVCAKTEGLNSHHIFSRSNFATRWDEENGVCLCVAHHVFGNFSAHKSPIEFVEWLKEHRDSIWYTALRQKAMSVYKPDYELIYADLKKKIAKLG